MATKASQRSRARRSDRRGKRPAPARRRRLTPAQREREAETRRRVLYALSRARRAEIPLSKAVRWAHTTLRAVERHAASLVTRTKGRRLEVVPYDRMKRPLRVLTPWGVIIVDVRDSRSASDLGRYWNAVDAALEGDLAALQPFVGRVLTVGKMRFPYLTDITLLNRLRQSGEVSFEDLYDTTR